ncbi:MAG: transglutaminase domain-containing protein [Lachnospiraceae bacterium]|nr:transglutaminase domain-containing protein [Lachnospiraceae bacterium]
MDLTRLTEAVYTFLYLLPLSLISSRYGYSLLGLAEPDSALYASAVILSLLMVVFLYQNARGRLIIAGIVFEMALLFILLRPAEERIPYMEEHIRYLYTFLMVLSLLLLVLFMNRFIVAKIIFAGLLLAFLAVMLALSREVPRMVVCLILFFILMTLAELIQLRWKKSGDNTLKKHLVLISPFILGVFIAAVSIKPPSQPYDWHFARKIYADLAVFFDRISIALFSGFGDSYESTVMGFSENGTLPGSIESAPRDILDLSAPGKRVSYMYLSGKTFDTFTGRTWEKTDDSGYNDILMDTLQTYAAVYSADPKYVSDYIRSEEISISYRHFKSRYLFLPNKAIAIPSVFPGLNLHYKGGDLLSDTLVTYKDAYTFFYYRLNQQTELFEKLASGPELIPRETWEKILTNFNLADDEAFTYDEYLNYAASTARTYSRPVALTERTQTFLDDLLKDAENDYEKLKALEAYFQDGDYETDPGPIPDDVDTEGEFLDYFLFENPKGFCSYYATAFTLLSRAAGIPCRYAQGYLADVDFEPSLIVDSGMAHSWPEVYIRNLGWVQFEPTPGRKITYSWSLASRNEEPVRPDIDSYPPPDIPDLPVIENDDQEEEIVKKPFDIRLVIIPVSVLLSSLIIFLIIEARRIMARYRDGSDSEKLRIMVGRNMKLLKMLDTERKPEETFSEFAVKAALYVPQPCLSFIPGYEEAIYGEKPVTKGQLSEAESSNRHLLRQLKEERKVLYPLLKLYSYL